MIHTHTKRKVRL